MVCSSDRRVSPEHVCPLPFQGEHFREVMKRIQSLLDIQEKEFEKVCASGFFVGLQ